MAATGPIDYQAIFDCIPTSLVLLSADLKIVAMNQQYQRTIGRNRDLVGRDIFDAFPAPGNLAGPVRESFLKVLRTGEVDLLPDIRYPIPAGDTADLDERYWSCSNLPVRDASGEVVFILQNAQDVTELHNLSATGSWTAKDSAASASAPKSGKAEAAPPISSLLDRAERIQALNASLLAESTQLRNIFMQAPSFMCVLRGADYRFELANSAFVALVGQRELLGRPLREAIPEMTSQVYVELLDTVVRTGEAFIGKQMRAEFQRRPEGTPEEVFINFVYQPIFDDAGQVVGVFIDGNDVTNHVRAERSQELLVRELHHRVRNTLATVQGVMNSTARTAETIEDYQWAFSGRISSLARTHSLLTEEIQQFVSFPQLLRQEVGVYAEGLTDRVVLEGPDLELPSQLAVPLGMTIHELSTNAYRHGALSLPNGRVTVTWSVLPASDRRVLVCHWVESGGPPVSPPERKGFGSMILTRVLSQQIGAKVEATYSVMGFEMVAEIPLDIERV